MKRYRIIFMGTPDFSVPVLEGLIDHYEVVLVVTQPDKKVGRKGEVKFPPVKEVALKHGIEVFQPEKLKDQYKYVLNEKADLIVTCAYGQLIPNEILDKFPHRAINVHASLLPKYRGGAPIHRAIMRGEFETGITIMEMVERLDAGDMISNAKMPITDYDTVGTMHDKLSVLGKELLLDTLKDLDKTERVKQNEIEATQAFNISREDEHINFNKSKREIYNHIRGLNPWPLAYAMLNNKEIKIYESYMNETRHYDKVAGEIVNIYKDGIGIATKDGEIVITVIKEEGKNKMTVKDYLNGLSDKEKLIGKVFM